MTDSQIIVSFIPHETQRYSTCGDFYYDAMGDLIVNVSDTGDKFMNRLIAIHEIIEETLTLKRGIPEPEIMAFDIHFEKEREEGLHTEIDEPGDDPRAPYRNEHHFAEIIEKMVAVELGIDWDAYCKMVYSMDYYNDPNNQHGLRS